MIELPPTKYQPKIEEKLKVLSTDLLPKPFGLFGKIWVAVNLIVALAGLYFYIEQLREGLIITALRDYTPWGIYISNFVFFVAISLVGSLISAILKLTGASWRTPMTRISEIIAVSAILFAAVTITIDMGRPDRFINLLLHGRMQSPITWDVIVIATYLIVSIILLYAPMIPDLAYMRDRFKNIPGWQHKIYKILAINWRNTDEQKQILNRVIKIMAIMIIPIAFGIHTVTSWLFASTLRPGWDSTNFGPYFVSGAFMVGAAGVITAMYVFRKFQNMKGYFTDTHFDKMGRLLVLLSLIYFYFNLNEYFIPAYKLKGVEAEHLIELVVGRYAILFWTTQILGMILPIIVLLFKKGRKPLPMFIMSLLVIVGAWFKRFLIVVPTLNHPYIPIQRVPEDWLHYTPTLKEWIITGGTLAGALLIITLFVRLFPIVPILETAEEELAKEMEN
ncbi:MAG: polysulfide reductase NrfD [Saprospiraceae bacterium]|nr:polysulfide reductase NrfD [Saprospiraceae bacterium]